MSHVDSYVRAVFAILLTLVANEAFAQTPTIAAGDWVRIDFKARFQGDLRKSEAPIRGDEDGGVDIARRRVGVEGRVAKVFDYQVEYELGEQRWRDVYVDYRQFKALQVRAGMFKLPFGLDENTSATNLDFIYRARISARLAPGRDRGLSVHGKVLKNFISYEGGVFRNDGENARPSNSTRVFGKRTVAARVLVHPFRRSKGVAATLQLGGAITSGEVPLGFPAVRARTVLGEPFYNSDVWVYGRRQRTGLEARWQPGRMSIQSEYIRLSDQRRGQSVDNGDLSPLVAQGWYLSGTYNVLRKRHRLGQLEIAARYETIGFGTGSGAGAASTSTRADAVLGNVHRAITLGANWHVNRWVKIQGNLVREHLGRPALGPKPDSPGFWSRVVRLQLTL